jgi:hypothetical protein
LGTFFSLKLRSAVYYHIFQQSGDTNAGKAALEHYEKARDAWASMAERAKNVYRANVSYGNIPKRGGHWLDRLPGIDSDLAAMKTNIGLNRAETISRRVASDEMNAVAGKPHLAVPVECSHTPPDAFTPGDPLKVKLTTSGFSSREGANPMRSVRLHYRHVSQAERWHVIELNGKDGAYTVAIPSEYSQSEFALEYYFELSDARGVKWMYPGFNETLSNQPYFAVCKRTD